ncbi:MAG TPA: thermonuclease family protein, partial [Spirochaetota bacterium]|nr:thermonuclease family protein [Spirochaetota bacterium]
RLLGIDAPEIHHPDVPVEKYGYKAYYYLKNRILGKTCKIEYNTSEKYDKYGRLLAYIYLDNVFINGELVEKGFAYIYNRSEGKKSGELRRLEQEARENNKGLWKKK